MALAALAISGAAGVAIGLLAGYYRGRLDDWLMRLVDVQMGDTVTARAVGRFQCRGRGQRMSVPIRIWREAAGLRVVGKFTMPAADLVEVYEISRLALGLGVGTGIWKYLHLGFDVVLRSGA